MVDYNEQESPERPFMKRFIEKNVVKRDHTRCVDGRPDKTVLTEKGPQMLGGTLHPIIVSVLEKNISFNPETVSSKAQQLKDAGYGIGVHRDNHHHEGITCGCGFCDKLPAIITTVKKQKEEILSRMKTLLGEGDIYTTVEKAFPIIEQFQDENIKNTGEPIIEAAKAAGAAVEIVEGDHKEAVAFVNLKPGKTFDTNQANAEGWQAFNLDLWAAVEQAQALGVNKEFAQGASIILYVATEIVLVEQNGKPQLDVVVNS